MKMFTPLVVSTAFFTCSLPLNLDTHRYCPFQCRYCFMRNRVIGKRNLDSSPNINWLKNKFQKVYDDKNIDPGNFIEVLLKNKIDLHCGTKSEAFSPNELTDHNTRKIIDICNDYNQKIVFTTKSDTYYDVNVTPDNHSFQFSITNHYNDKFLEPNVPPLDKRIAFYNQLKDEGFKVGIRIEPFIPNVTKIDKIVELFDDIDYVHISQLMMLPQLKHDDLIGYIGCSKSDFKTKGVTVLKEDLLYLQLKPYFEYLENNGYEWNSRFMNVGNQNCCCGDKIVRKSTTFDMLHLKQKYGDNWTLEQGLNELGEYKQCRCDSLYTSNRRNGLKTVEEFYKDRWNKPSCKFNPKNEYKPIKTLADFMN